MPRSKHRLPPIAALLLLCLVWAWASLRPEFLPGPAAGLNLPPLIGEAALLALFAVVAEAGALMRRARWLPGRVLATAALVGLGLFVAPALLNDFGKAWIDDSSRVALFALTPVFAVIFEPYLSLGSPGGVVAPEQRGGLAAALVAVLGTLLVFPMQFPQSVASCIAFCGVPVSAAAIAAANCLGVRAGEDADVSMLSFAAACAGIAAVCLGAVGAVLRGGASSAVTFNAWTALDFFALALLFWLMRRLSAVRMTTRFVIAPLLANLIGLAFLRPQVQPQAWLGLLLVALGSGWLLFAPEKLADATGSILGID